MFFDWMFYPKGDKNRPVNLDDWRTTWRRSSKTQAVVLDLVSQEGISKNSNHIIWLDNLFTFTSLLTVLKKEGFGGAGTVRTTKTEREEQKDQAQKGQDRGLDRSLAVLKLRHNTQLLWGNLYVKLSHDKEVLQLAWKDQSVFLFMTTVSTGK